MVCSELRNLPDGFGDDDAIEQIHDAMGVFGVRMGVTDHDNGRTFAI
jgi:hypothetical protein